MVLLPKKKPREARWPGCSIAWTPTKTVRSTKTNFLESAPPQPGAGNAQFLEGIMKRFDKNKDGKITKEEAAGSKLAEYFDRMDANKDGALDKQELQRVRPANPPAGNPFVSQLMEKLDQNKDGVISKEEAKGKLAEYFERLDANKDGKLDKSELNRLRPAGDRFGPGRPQAQGPDFDALDKDADGRLTAEELKGTPLARQFAEMDADKNGKVTPKEFADFFKKQNEKK
ncbi:MAG: hypothetical protein KatS3mg105_1575 [Gemmatales bacterium]|nr:MAG: hypothetical protein KatS3mg105_1575 [Gemmatales bacterium]